MRRLADGSPFTRRTCGDFVRPRTHRLADGHAGRIIRFDTGFVDGGTLGRDRLPAITSNFRLIPGLALQRTGHRQPHVGSANHAAALDHRGPRPWEANDKTTRRRSGAGALAIGLIAGGDLAGTINSALFGNAYTSAVLNLVPSWRQSAIIAAFILLSFPNLTLPFFVHGCRHIARRLVDRAPYRFVVAALVIHALFAVRYNVIDQHTFLLPSYVYMVVLAGVGWSAVLKKTSTNRRRRLILGTILLLATTPVAYLLVPSVARRFDILQDVAHRKPYRDDYAYLFTPWSVTDRSASRLGAHAIDLAGRHGLIIVEDGMTRPAVEYLRLRDDRTDLGVVEPSQNGQIDDRRIRDLVAAGRHVVLVPFDRNRPAISAPIGQWRRTGDLYLLEAQ